VGGREDEKGVVAGSKKGGWGNGGDEWGEKEAVGRRIRGGG